ncbi:MAG: iron ABC transporter substrate-binding protein [Deltaproteobacteria bacterium]|nr:iron ABC transporter substrate-binding protein [Deltaproteobacteria bacterium]MBW2084618.1 iron ABC transporter substrate-binding protein [Deltaproteobacteria bacterium]
MKRFLFICCALIAVLVITSGDWVQAGNKIAIKDMVGREVIVPQNPDRIICVAPGTLRLIIYLGGKNKVIGVEGIEKRFPFTRPYWIANNDLGRLPSIGPGGPNSINKEPDLEAILAVSPEVIFISYMERDKAEALQKKIGIPVVVLTYGPFGTFNEVVYDSLRVAGQVLAKEKRAEEVISFIESARKDLLSRVEGFPKTNKPSVYVGGIGFKGTHGIESTETIYAPFEWVKARNAAKVTGKKGHMFINKEKILALNPDIIFLDGGGSERVRQDYEKKPEFYQSLKAFKKRQVYMLHSFNWYMTNIGTVISDAYTVGKILYPKKFADVDLGVKADEIYTFLIGQPVYGKMIKIHGPLGQVLPYLK